MIYAAYGKILGGLLSVCKRRLTVLALFCASLFYIFMKNCSFFGNFCLFCERFDNLYQRFCRFYFSNESSYLSQVFLNINSLFMSFFNENSSATITLIHQRNLMFCKKKHEIVFEIKNEI